ncbi:ParA family protein [Telluribacter humicola]|uniref:ParA family protein n=1 Tax=Telluribacter humicola TaxID=1720261 RepID=UPI001A95657D|nr:ParA family protein [Telluribacter humicola]
MANYSKVISFFNHKGGVGKTTTTLNLGKALHLLGYNVLLIDLDPQGNLTQSLGYEELEKSILTYLDSDNPQDLPLIRIEDKFNLIPSSLELETAVYSLVGKPDGQFKVRGIIESVEGFYDFILIDCPPSLGILSVNALTASDEIIIVVDAEKFSINNLSNVISTIEGVQKRLNRELQGYRLLINKMSNRVIKKEINKVVRDSYGKLVLKTEIHDRIAVVEAAGQNTDVLSHDADSPSAKEYISLAKELISLHGKEII